MLVIMLLASFVTDFELGLPTLRLATLTNFHQTSLNLNLDCVANLKIRIFERTLRYRTVSWTVLLFEQCTVLLRTKASPGSFTGLCGLALMYY